MPGPQGQPQIPRTPEQDVPLMERLKRMLPGMLGGPQGDMRLPMEVGQQRDTRLPPPSPFDAIREGLEQTHDLGQTAITPQEQTALQAIQRMGGMLKK